MRARGADRFWTEQTLKPTIMLFSRNLGYALAPGALALP